MRKIYLHIGCEKTGSSAIQVWLNQNSSKFYEKGIFYPTLDGKINNPYKITSGNGSLAVKAINKGKAKQFFVDLFQERDGDIFLSSEQFQSLADDQIVDVRAILLSFDVDPVIIVFLRDIYDVLFSKYNQLVKRHFYDKTFMEYVFSLEKIEQFDVIDRWSKYFGNIKAIHYDSNKYSLDSAILKAIGLNENDIPGMQKAIVNRSLTFFELELIRYVNKLYNEKFYKKNYDFPEKINNILIESDPEKVTSIFYNKKADDFINEKFGSDVARVNKEYFKSQNLLKVFCGKGKKISENIPKIEKEYLIVINEIIKMDQSFSFKWKNLVSKYKQYIPWI